jgi:hypothetical protein
MNKSSMSGQHLLARIREADPKDLAKARRDVEREMLKQEMKHALDPVPSGPPPLPPRVTPSERVRAETTEQFNAGLDVVTDVLLILMLKFSRAATMVRTAIFVLLGCFIGIAVTLASQHDTAAKMEDVSLRIERVESQQRYLSKETQEAFVKLDQTKKTVDEAANEIKGQPKLEVIQERGKTKLIIKER